MGMLDLGLDERPEPSRDPLSKQTASLLFHKSLDSFSALLSSCAGALASVYH